MFKYDQSLTYSGVLSCVLYHQDEPDSIKASLVNFGEGNLYQYLPTKLYPYFFRLSRSAPNLLLNDRPVPEIG